VESEVYPLGKPVYGDFVAFARQQQLTATFLKDYSRLRRVYAALGGNFRGLEFFAHAIDAMSSTEEQGFLDAMRQAEADAQADMALQAVIDQRSEAERALLQRLLAYQTAVPADGIKKLALPDLPESERLLNNLLAVSLVERYEAPDLAATEEYQLAPLVRDWLQAQGAPAPSQALLHRAADYQLHLLNHERPTLTQAMITHQALTAAGRSESAHRLALDRIVGPLNRAGLYHRLLDDWLPAACAADDPQTRADARGQTGKQYIHIGDYDTALSYLKQSLAIQQEIGDKSGEGATLNNISQIFKARGDYDTALSYLKQSLAITQEIGDVAGLCATLFNIGHIHLQNEEGHEALSAWLQVYRLAKPMQLTQALDALEHLADQLGLPDGMQAWEKLAEQIGEG
jgi:tetratricopeptide (TPR) repeat protein